MRILLFVVALLPTPAAALEYCEELWFTRNLVFHNAGYCFGSTLGKSVFGNEGCVGKDVSLTPEAASIVKRVQDREAFDNCKVDTAATRLPIPIQGLRRALGDIPVPTEFESSCFGWQAAPLPLFLARDRNAPVSGTIVAGDSLLFQFEDEGDWTYIEVVRGNQIVAAGWNDAKLPSESCEGWAG